MTIDIDDVSGSSKNDFPILTTSCGAAAAAFFQRFPAVLGVERGEDRFTFPLPNFNLEK